MRLLYKGELKMNQSKTRQVSKWSIGAISKMGMVTALYVAVTIFLSVMSFGVIQIRLSEGFNFLAIYNKRYILSITLGVMIANIASPLGIVDVIIGGSATFLTLLGASFVAGKISHPIWKIVATTIIFSFSMFTVAGELAFFYQLPFWSTWGIVGLGELISMSLGGVLMHLVNKKIDLSV